MDIINNSTNSTNSNSSYFGEFPNSSKFLYELLTIAALIVSTVAIIANFLTALAVRKVKSTSAMSSHFRLVLNLAIGDGLLALSVLFHHLNQSLNSHSRSKCFYMIIKSLNSTFLLLILFNLLAMATDHYFAVFKPLHYPTIFTKGRTTILIGLLWALSAISGFSDWLTPLGRPKKLNYCQKVYWTKYNEEYVVFVLAPFCFVLMTLVYIKVYGEVKRQRNRMEAGGANEMLRNNKALFTTLLIIVTFAACWLPLCFYQVTLIVISQVNAKLLLDRTNLLMTLDKCIYNIMLLNSIADPIIYAVRMREVRKAYRRLFCKRPIRSFDRLRYFRIGLKRN
ncbi:DgyrCDS3771 [Dimorphilus gyrociliatus]|uniref:DgyrCDS3771 n=1 Tax=Dimorphilus gyrociliatus TaxID=2664684 RepID=A0A7I8VJI9_9ANNE|nr:DgyrCDS3771 [Dimorphilus gyrociliatus]